MTGSRKSSDLWIAAGIVLVLMVVYNANGREIGSFDSQPNKFAARELLLRHTLSLNHVVGASPQLADRPGFAVDREGRIRSAYSPVSPVLAAAIAWPLWKTRILDIRAPRAPNVIAALGASLLTALAVALAYVTARARATRARSLLIAAGLGLGTGYWCTISQTLWVHETAVFGLAIATWAFAAPAERLHGRAAALIGLGLALAGTARPQLAPLILVLLAGTVRRAGVRQALTAVLIVVLAAGGLMLLYLQWFGNVMGPVSAMVALNNSVHATRSTFHAGLDGFAGLLFSPSRGLLVFSPVVLVGLAGIRAAAADGWERPLRWCGIAALAQYAFYGSYSVWWAGHTYGPRYMLDVLPLLVPLAADVLVRMRLRSAAGVAAGAALAWSITAAATGAFCYPNDAWNTDPVDVDRSHARLWDWRDSQVARCWQRGPSPQNFNLFTREAWSTEKEPPQTEQHR